MRDRKIRIAALRWIAAAWMGFLVMSPPLCAAGAEETAIGDQTAGTAAEETAGGDQTADAAAEGTAGGNESGAAARAVTTVEYGKLGELLVQGNLDLQQANNNYETNKKNYQKILDSLREEQDYMKFLADKYEDDPEAKASYSANAAILGNSASQVSRRIDSLNGKSQTLSVEKNVDNYTITAQTRMNSYNQMALNVAAKEKSVQAAEASYNAVLKKQLAGAATSADVSAAANRLEKERNLLTSYRQQESQMRFQLLSMLGLPDDGSVSIGKIPEPDLAAIEAVNFEEDRQKAVNNNNSVKNVRHSNAGTTAEIQRKFTEETEAVGNAEVEIDAVYQQMQASKLSYQAARDSYQSAVLNYESLKRRQQAGILTQTEYLEGEASYLQAVSEMGAASMNLYQAYESYQWEVKGIPQN